MPTLDFKGKSFVYTHHLSVPFQELVVDAKKSLPIKGQKPSLKDNLIIHGDNLHALKALLPVFAGKVDCIYIDPPYNTGNEGWCYNDNVRSPLMKEWLKKSANPVEKDDLERHEKWLCMMWPRLRLLHELLAPHGVIFISIDDNEFHRMRTMLDEIFLEPNFVACFSIKANPRGRQSDEYVANIHEYCLCYAKRIDDCQLNGLPLTVEEIAEFDQEDSDGSKWRELGLRQRGAGSLREDRPDMFFQIYVNPDDGTVSLKKSSKHSVKVEPKKSDGRDGRWMWSPKKVEDEISRVYGRKVSRREGFDIFIKDYLDRNGEQRTSKPRSMWLDGLINTELGGKLLNSIFDKKVFDYPKPIGLIERILKISTRKDSIVLDSFAGSGTTAHAVLSLNQKDGLNRKFIVVQLSEGIEDDHPAYKLGFRDVADLTAERVRRVARGYKFEGMLRQELIREPITLTTLKKADQLLEKADGFDLLDKHRFDRITKSVVNGALVVTGEKKVTEKVEGLGGSFTFCTLGEEMGMDRLLAGDKMPSFDALAKYVFYTATGQTLVDVQKQKADGDGFIGETELYRVHLFYKPEKKWLQSNKAALTEKLVDNMVTANTRKKKLLIFAAAKFMSQRELSRHGVDFCQLPYAIHRILGD